jgi:uncharacterized protein YdbL (DUF1318 family)
MKNLLVLKLAVLTGVLVACVTINVNFPAAATEKAADRIIGDVIGKADEAPPAAKPPTGSIHGRDEPGGAGSLGNTVLVALRRVLDQAVPSAQAAEPDLDVSTPAVRQITDSMKARHGQLAPYYDSGAIGYTGDALVDVRDANLIPLAERNSVRKLVGDENRDRAALYAEIARANGHPEWEPGIRATFAKRWIANSKAGWYFNDGGGWRQH